MQENFRSIKNFKISFRRQNAYYCYSMDVFLNQDPHVPLAHSHSTPPSLVSQHTDVFDFDSYMDSQAVLSSELIIPYEDDCVATTIPKHFKPDSIDIEISLTPSTDSAAKFFVLNASQLEMSDTSKISVLPYVAETASDVVILTSSEDCTAPLEMAINHVKATNLSKPIRVGVSRTVKKSSRVYLPSQSGSHETETISHSSIINHVSALPQIIEIAVSPRHAPPITTPSVWQSTPVIHHHGTASFATIPIQGIVPRILTSAMKPPTPLESIASTPLLHDISSVQLKANTIVATPIATAVSTAALFSPTPRRRPQRKTAQHQAGRYSSMLTAYDFVEHREDSSAKSSTVAILHQPTTIEERACELLLQENTQRNTTQSLAESVEVLTKPATTRVRSNSGKKIDIVDTTRVSEQTAVIADLANKIDAKPLMRPPRKRVQSLEAKVSVAPSYVPPTDCVVPLGHVTAGLDVLQSDTNINSHSDRCCMAALLEPVQLPTKPQRRRSLSSRSHTDPALPSSKIALSVPSLQSPALADAEIPHAIDQKLSNVAVVMGCVVDEKQCFEAIVPPKPLAKPLAVRRTKNSSAVPLSLNHQADVTSSNDVVMTELSALPNVSTKILIPAGPTIRMSRKTCQIQSIVSLVHEPAVLPDLQALCGNIAYAVDVVNLYSDQKIINDYSNHTMSIDKRVIGGSQSSSRKRKSVSPSEAVLSYRTVVPLLRSQSVPTLESLLHVTPKNSSLVNAASSEPSDQTSTLVFPIANSVIIIASQDEAAVSGFSSIDSSVSISAPPAIIGAMGFDEYSGVLTMDDNQPVSFFECTEPLSSTVIGDCKLATSTELSVVDAIGLQSWSVSPLEGPVCAVGVKSPSKPFFKTHTIVTSPVHHLGHFAQSGTVVPMSPAVYKDIDLSIDVPAQLDPPDSVRLLFMQCRALESSMGLVCALALAQLYSELREHTGANNDILSKESQWFPVWRTLTQFLCGWMVLESRLRSFEEERERAIESERAIQCDINQNPSIPADSYAPRELGDVVDSEMHDVCLGSITVDSSAACEGRAKRARRKLKFCTYDFSAVENPSDEPDSHGPLNLFTNALYSLLAAHAPVLHRNALMQHPETTILLIHFVQLLSRLAVRAEPLRLPVSSEACLPLQTTENGQPTTTSMLQTFICGLGDEFKICVEIAGSAGFRTAAAYLAHQFQQCIALAMDSCYRPYLHTIGAIPQSTIHHHVHQMPFLNRFFDFTFTLMRHYLKLLFNLSSEQITDIGSVAMPVESDVDSDVAAEISLSLHELHYFSILPTSPVVASVAHVSTNNMSSVTMPPPASVVVPRSSQQLLESLRDMRPRQLELRLRQLGPDQRSLFRTYVRAHAKLCNIYGRKRFIKGLFGPIFLGDVSFNAGLWRSIHLLLRRALHLETMQPLTTNAATSHTTDIHINSPPASGYDFGHSEQPAAVLYFQRLQSVFPYSTDLGLCSDREPVWLFRAYEPLLFFREFMELMYRQLATVQAVDSMMTRICGAYI